MGFKNRFSDPIELGQKHTVTKRALAEGRKAVQELAKSLSHWFLRRTKALISDQLPKKDDRVSYWLAQVEKKTTELICMCSNMSCFLSCSSPGGLLLSHRLPAEGVSCCAGHRRCDPVVAELRKVSLWQWPSTEEVLLQTERKRCAG